MTIRVKHMRGLDLTTWAGRAEFYERVEGEECDLPIGEYLDWFDRQMAALRRDREKVKVRGETIELRGGGVHLRPITIEDMVGLELARESDGDIEALRWLAEQAAGSQEGTDEWPQAVYEEALLAIAAQFRRGESSGTGADDSSAPVDEHDRDTGHDAA